MLGVRPVKFLRFSTEKRSFYLFAIMICLLLTLVFFLSHKMRITTISFFFNKERKHLRNNNSSKTQHIYSFKTSFIKPSNLVRIILNYFTIKFSKSFMIFLLKTSVKWEPKNRIKISGSSRPEMFCKKGVLRNFAKFTRKHLCQSLFFNKVAGLRASEYRKLLG